MTDIVAELDDIGKRLEGVPVSEADPGNQVAGDDGTTDSGALGSGASGSGTIQQQTAELSQSSEPSELQDDQTPQISYKYDDSIHIEDFTNSFNLTDPYDKPDIRNVKYLTPTDHLQCPICQQPFIKPMTTLCGHTFCKECIFECFKMSPDLDSDTVGLCPLDRTPIDSSNPGDLFATPILINNLVDELKVSCLNSERGCEWNGCRWELEHHILSDCGFTGVRCNGLRHNGDICNLIVERRFIQDSEKEKEYDHKDQDSDKSSQRGDNLEQGQECIHKLFQCQYCRQEVTTITESHHLETQCLFNYQTCELCDNDMIPLKSLSHHQEYCSKNSKYICPAKAIGCKFIGSNEPSLENHLLNNCQLNNFLPVYQTLVGKVDDLSNDNKYLQKQINLILDLIIQGKITNLGYTEPIEEISRFKDFNDVDQDKLIYLNYEIDRLKYQVDEKLIPLSINKLMNENQ